MPRVNELLREVIASEVADLKDPGLGFVTITGVDTAPDLRAARVFYSVLGDDEQRAATAEALNRAAPRIRRAVAGQVVLKYLPALHFTYDEAVEQGIKIEQLLRDLDDEHDGEPADGPA